MAVRFGTVTQSIAGQFGNATANIRMRKNAPNIQQAFIEVFNKLIENKAELLSTYETIIATLTDTTKLDSESAKYQAECDDVLILIKNCVEENAHSAINQAEYKRKYEKLVEQFEFSKTKLSEIGSNKQELIVKQESISMFIKDLEQKDMLLTEFDEEVWNATVDRVTVFADKMVFGFRDGGERDCII